MEQYQSLAVSVEAHIGHIRLNRPEAMAAGKAEAPQYEDLPPATPPLFER